MTGTQRRRHFGIWIVLGAAILLGLTLAIAWRMPDPLATTPTSTAIGVQP